MADTVQVAGGRRPQQAERAVACELAAARVRVVRSQDRQLHGPILGPRKARLERPGRLLARTGRPLQRREAIPGGPALSGSYRLRQRLQAATVGLEQALER